MSVLNSIRTIINNSNLDLVDKLIEIEKLLPREIDCTKQTECLGLVGKKIGNTIVFDGSEGHEYTDDPNLQNPDDIFYTGCGCRYGTDMDGRRYHKLYSPFITKDPLGKYKNLEMGDIINEKYRMKKLIKECLIEMGYR